MSEWQPIETAPRDGTRILVSDADGFMIVAFWFADGWDDGDFRSGLTWPQYWMPLPPPPMEQSNA
jgi:hypothetical protein